MILKIPGALATYGRRGDLPVTFELDVSTYECDGEGLITIEVSDALTIRFRDPAFAARQAAAAPQPAGGQDDCG